MTQMPTRRLMLSLPLIGLPGVALAQHGGHGGHGHGGHSHDMTMTSSIADGAVLTTRPRSLTLSFAPAMRLKSARLVTATGEAIPVTFTMPAAAASVSVTFPALAPDRYTFSWTADAGDHDMSGRVRFQVR